MILREQQKTVWWLSILLSYLGGMLDICWSSKNERSWPDTLNSSLLDFSGDDRPPKIQKTFSRLDADPALSMGATGWASLVLESLLIAMAWCGTKSWFDSLYQQTEIEGVIVYLYRSWTWVFVVPFDKRVWPSRLCASAKNQHLAVKQSQTNVTISVGV